MFGRALTKQMQKVVIESYLASSEADIERSVGRILLSREQGFTPAAADDELLMERVRVYLRNKLPIFRQRICVEWDLNRRLRDSEFADNAEIVAAIADLIAPLVGVPPAAMIATLLFKKGLNQLCGG